MPRIRTIKPEFFKHEGLYDLEVETGLPLRVAFAGIWTVCDREGRFQWRPRTIKPDVLPHDTVDFSRVLDALASRGFLVKYAIGTCEYGYIPSWGEHQFVNGKESKSVIPPPNQQLDALASRESRVNYALTTREEREADATTTGGVKERKGKEREGKEQDGFSAPSFDGGEWALKTLKAYPTWDDQNAMVAPARLADAYMATIKTEAPHRGGLLKTAEWFLSLVVEYKRQHPDGKFVMNLENFLRKGYVEVKSPAKKTTRSLSERLEAMGQA